MRCLLVCVRACLVSLYNLLCVYLQDNKAHVSSYAWDERSFLLIIHTFALCCIIVGRHFEGC